MPATTKQIAGKWRVVEGDGQLVRNKKGTPVDGGGYSNKPHAARQARAINASQNT